MADDDVASSASEAPEEPDAVEDAPEAKAPAKPDADPELRTRMRTLDRTERKWGYVAGGFVLVISTVIVPSLLHTTYGAPYGKKTASGHCLAGFRLVDNRCQTVYHPRDFALQFSLLVVLGVILLVSVWRSKRSLTIFTAMFTGLASAFAGVAIVLIVGLGYGGWLLARSWRLQRYGTTDSKAVRQAATERAEAKRAERRAGKQAAKSAAAGEPQSAARASVTASKRYTPKSKPRRR